MLSRVDIIMEERVVGERSLGQMFLQVAIIDPLRISRLGMGETEKLRS